MSLLKLGYSSINKYLPTYQSLSLHAIAFCRKGNPCDYLLDFILLVGEYLLKKKVYQDYSKRQQFYFLRTCVVISFLSKNIISFERCKRTRKFQ